MTRRVTWVIGGWCAVVVLLAAVATAGPVHLWQAPPASKLPDEISATTATTPVETAPLRPPSDGGGQLPDWVGIVFDVIAVAIIVGALIAAGTGALEFSELMGFIAIALASVNIFGGFLVTHRMLSMFKKKQK